MPRIAKGFENEKDTCNHDDGAHRGRWSVRKRCLGGPRPLPWSLAWRPSSPLWRRWSGAGHRAAARFGSGLGSQPPAAGSGRAPAGSGGAAAGAKDRVVVLLPLCWCLLPIRAKLRLRLGSRAGTTLLRIVRHDCPHRIGRLFPMRMRDHSRLDFTDVLSPDLNGSRAGAWPPRENN
jgi:hypothetical protein